MTQCPIELLPGTLSVMMAICAPVCARVSMLAPLSLGSAPSDYHSSHHCAVIIARAVESSAAVVGYSSVAIHWPYCQIRGQIVC